MDILTPNPQRKSSKHTSEMIPKGFSPVYEMYELIPKGKNWHASPP